MYKLINFSKHLSTSFSGGLLSVLTWQIWRPTSVSQHIIFSKNHYKNSTNTLCGVLMTHLKLFQLYNIKFINKFFKRSVMFPSVFVILKNKNLQTYDQVYQILHLIKGSTFFCIKTNYEKLSRKAESELYLYSIFCMLILFSE